MNNEKIKVGAIISDETSRKSGTHFAGVLVLRLMHTKTKTCMPIMPRMVSSGYLTIPSGYATNLLCITSWVSLNSCKQYLALNHEPQMFEMLSSVGASINLMFCAKTQCVCYFHCPVTSSATTVHFISVHQSKLFHSLKQYSNNGNKAFKMSVKGI